MSGYRLRITYNNCCALYWSNIYKIMEDKQQPTTLSWSKQPKENKPHCQCGEKAKYYCDEDLCEMHEKCIFICDECIIDIMKGVKEKHLMFPLRRFQIIYETKQLPIIEKQEQIRGVVNEQNKQVFAYLENQDGFNGRRVINDLEKLENSREELNRFALEYEECIKSSQFSRLKLQINSYLFL
ncbi:hypothetical protein FGO68_gene8449 [Halteria grandinella]|uniref:Uncharacterized protein n=1 Tax=Halteria grandinella TaxID=5974 RepID=A0A8J8T454_HALGN|nr:hypothetical protein FGO68_gene8449 [Halteria grandinella]